MQANAAHGFQKASKQRNDSGNMQQIIQKNNDQKIQKIEKLKNSKKVFTQRDQTMVQHNLKYMHYDQNSVPDSNQLSDYAASNIALVENVELNMTKSDINDVRVTSTSENMQKQQTLTQKELNNIYK